jgi:hypothetical protein
MEMEEGEEEEAEETFEDNGEFSAGAILTASLRSCERKYGPASGGGGNTGNILLVVTRKVMGCFVADILGGPRSGVCAAAQEKF